MHPEGSVLFAVVLGLCPAIGISQERQITPDSIRVEPLENDAEGGWITLAGYREIGSPAISQNGEWVAFDAHKDGFNRSPAEIWLARRDGSDLHKLTNGGTPRWSPDSSTLIFMRRDEPGAGAAEPEIYTINRDGTGEQLICNGRWPDWSPDGKRIAFSLGGTPGGGTRPFSRVYISHVDGTGERLIADGDCASWSPDGTKIACCQADPAYPAPIVRIIDLQSGRQQIVGFGWFRANWLPDGKHVVANGVSPDGRPGMVRLASERRAPPELIFEEFGRASAPCYCANAPFAIFIAERQNEH